jgi:hypothetical protein
LDTPSDSAKVVEADVNLVDPVDRRELWEPPQRLGGLDK